MNKKVFVSMLILTICFLTGLYIAKIFFPEQFMMSIQNGTLISIGTFIDSHKWLYYLCTGITAFITYWLFLCGCKGKWYLNWKEIIAVIVVIVIVRLIGFVNYDIRTHISICSFFILPLIFRHDLKKATVIYAVHGLAQILSLTIRNLPIYLRTANFITIFCFGIECYLWLTLFYIIFNYPKNKEKQNEV